jgi:hypothetical protein
MSRGRHEPLLVRSVTVTINGVAYHGTYFVQHTTVYVRSPLGTNSALVGGSPPEKIAKLLLGEMARATKHED